MKKFLAIILSAVVLLSGCGGGVSQAEYDAVVSERDALQEKLNRSESELDKANIPDLKQHGLEYDELRDALELMSAYSDDPNSAGGVDFSVRFNYYQKERTAKYITIKAVPYNAVDDIVACEIKGTSLATLKITGPFERGNTYSSRYENAWYNSTIKYAVISEITIEYADGEIITCSSGIPIDRRERPLQSAEVGKPL